MICQKCGMKLKKINYRHKEFCDNVPPPQALAREYLDSGKTYEELATDYDVSLNGLRMRVLFGLALLGEPAHPIGRRAGPPAPKPAPECDLQRCGCGIILRTAVQLKRGTCEFCAGTTFDYMKYKRGETAVQRAIPVSVSLSY